MSQVFSGFINIRVPTSTMSSQCMYKPSRLIHIKLEGPKVSSDGLHFASPGTRFIHLSGNTAGSSQNGCPSNHSGYHATHCQVLKRGSHKPLTERGKISVPSFSETHSRHRDDSDPFYLSIMNNDLGRSKMITTTSVSGSSSNNNNRARRIMSNRRLQQLINITTLTDDCKSKESEKEAKKEKKSPVAKSQTKVSGAEKRRDDRNPNSGGLAKSLYRLDTDLAMATLQDYEDDNATFGNINQTNQNRPRADFISSTPKKERWATHPTIMTHVPSHLCKVKASLEVTDSRHAHMEAPCKVFR